MEILITAIHSQISDSVKEYARDKASKLDKYFDKAKRTQVNIHAESGSYDVELICHANQHTFTVNVHTRESVQEAIDLAIDKISRQLRRYKDKLKSHKGRERRKKLGRDVKRVTQRLKKIDAASRKIKASDRKRTGGVDKYDAFFEEDRA